MDEMDELEDDQPELTPSNKKSGRFHKRLKLRKSRVTTQNLNHMAANSAVVPNSGFSPSNSNVGGDARGPDESHKITKEQFGDYLTLDKAARQKPSPLKPKFKEIKQSSMKNLKSPPNQMLNVKEVKFNSQTPRSSNSKKKKLENSGSETENEVEIENPDKAMRVFMTEEFENPDMELSYSQLQNHIRQNHPKLTNEDHWPLNTPMGKLFNFSANREIPAILKDIGLGASLYLLTLKTYAFFFLFIAVLSTPMLMIYMSGNESDQSRIAGIGYIYGTLNIGNIGESGPTCQMLDMSVNRGSVSLSCNSGTLQSFVGVGLSAQKNQQCTVATMNHTVTLLENLDGTLFIRDDYLVTDGAKFLDFYIKMHPHCSTFLSDQMLESTFIQNLITEFDKNCKDKRSCSVSFDYMDLPQQCLDVLMERAKYAFN